MKITPSMELRAALVLAEHKGRPNTTEGDHRLAAKVLNAALGSEPMPTMDQLREEMAEHFQAVLDRVNNAELPRVADVPEPTAVAGRLNPDRIRLYYLETKLAKVRQWAAPENEESQDEYASLRAILDEP